LILAENGHRRRILSFPLGGPIPSRGEEPVVEVSATDLDSTEAIREFELAWDPLSTHVTALSIEFACSEANFTIGQASNSAGGTAHAPGRDGPRFHRRSHAV
jgi:hypothetical protein